VKNDLNAVFAEAVYFSIAVQEFLKYTIRDLMAVPGPTGCAEVNADDH